MLDDSRVDAIVNVNMIGPEQMTIRIERLKAAIRRAVRDPEAIEDVVRFRPGEIQLAAEELLENLDRRERILGRAREWGNPLTDADKTVLQVVTREAARGNVEAIEMLASGELNELV
jgi:hypothetical protein